MAKVFGWASWLSIPVGLITAIFTADPKYFAIGLILSIWLLTAALMLLRPDD